jgi:hypothetical protein
LREVQVGRGVTGIQFRGFQESVERFRLAFQRPFAFANAHIKLRLRFLVASVADKRFINIQGFSRLAGLL